MNLITDPIPFGEWDDELIAVACKHCREMVLASPAAYAVEVAITHQKQCEGNALRLVECIPAREKASGEGLPKIN